MVEQVRDLRAQYGYDVVAIIDDLPGPLAAELHALSIPTYLFNLHFLGIRDLLSIGIRIIRLASLFRRERFDVVHTHLFHSMLMGRIAAWLADVPVRLTMVANPRHFDVPAARWIDRSTCWMDTALIASCEYTRTHYRALGVNESRIILIYYGPDASRFDPQSVAPVDLRQEYGWGPETRLIGNVAHFYADAGLSRWLPDQAGSAVVKGFKGQEEIIRAARLVHAEFPEARFLLIGAARGEGSGRFQEQMCALVRQLGLEGLVVFPGYRTDVPGILRALDVSVQAARVENVGGTVESLLMECPTVATRVGGMVDSVQDGVTGVLVEPGNPASLAQGIMRLLRDPREARRLGKAGRALMLPRFTLSRTVADLDQLYREALRRRRGGYRWWVSAGRSLLCVPLVPYLLARGLLIGMIIPCLWDLLRSTGRSTHDVQWPPEQ
jgi:glycosyltransferase involved in cell wall biosynthesis